MGQCNQTRITIVQGSMEALHQSTRNAVPSCFDELWHEWYARIFTYAREFALGRDEDREEAVSDILLKAWDKRAQYNSRWAWSTWLYRLARTSLIDRQRSWARWHQHQQEPGDDAPEPVDGRSTFRPESVADARETRLTVRRAVETLSPLDRELLALAYGEDLDMESIATITGLNTNTVKSRLHRARERLRTLLEEES